MNDTRDTHVWLTDQVAQAEEQRKRVERAFRRPAPWSGGPSDDSLPETYLTGKFGLVILLVGVALGITLTLLVDVGAAAWWAGRFK